MKSELNLFEAVTQHYALGNTLQSITTGLDDLGKEFDNIEVDDLSPVDEFHTGGRVATELFLNQLGFGSDDKVLDIGCGIGGSARYVADRFGSKVRGIDLTKEYIATGQILNDWVGLGEQVNLHIGNALSINYPERNFDGAFAMHVFMNVENKAQAFKEAFRILKPGSLFGVFDITKYGEGDLAYPLPWANGLKTSFLASADEYVEHLESAGFEIVFCQDRYQFALDFFEKVKARLDSGDGPPPLGIHMLMGSEAKRKVDNLAENLKRGLLAPFEICARRPKINNIARKGRKCFRPEMISVFD